MHGSLFRLIRENLRVRGKIPTFEFHSEIGCYQNRNEAN